MLAWQEGGSVTVTPDEAAQPTASIAVEVSPCALVDIDVVEYGQEQRDESEAVDGVLGAWCP